jgi:hypothetical protein
MDRMQALCDEHEQRCDEHPCKTTKHVYATLVLAEQVERIADALTTPTVTSHPTPTAQEKQARDFRAHQRKKAKGQL